MKKICIFIFVIFLFNYNLYGCEIKFGSGFFCPGLKIMLWFILMTPQHSKYFNLFWPIKKEIWNYHALDCNNRMYSKDVEKRHLPTYKPTGAHINMENNFFVSLCLWMKRKNYLKIRYMSIVFEKSTCTARQFPTSVGGIFTTRVPYMWSKSLILGNKWSQNFFWEKYNFKIYYWVFRCVRIGAPIQKNHKKNIK